MLERYVGTRYPSFVVEMAEGQGLLSGDHFNVDSTLLTAWVVQKGFKRKDGADDGRPPDDWHGRGRSKFTHDSMTDPESRVDKKTRSTAAQLAYPLHALTDNRHALVVNVRTSQAIGAAERGATMAMVSTLTNGRRVTLAADRKFPRGFVKIRRGLGMTRHFAQSARRIGGSAIDGRTVRHAGYNISMRKCEQFGKCFGWAETIGGLRQLVARGLKRIEHRFTVAMPARPQRINVHFGSSCSADSRSYCWLSARSAMTCSSNGPTARNLDFRMSDFDAELSIH